MPSPVREQPRPRTTTRTIPELRERSRMEEHERFEPRWPGSAASGSSSWSLERGLDLASRAFVALLPSSIVLAASDPPPQRRLRRAALIDRFDLTRPWSRADVRQLFATPAEVRGGTTVVEIIVLMYAVFSFGRQLARTDERPGGCRGPA